MNPFRSRTPRTIILTLLGFALAFGLAVILTPHWPDFCDDTVIGAACDVVAVRTMMGYLLLALGILTIIFGPIAGSLIDVVLNGAKWETPRGSESIITNMPLLIGVAYVASGVLVVATA
jgi:hypothetical protein